MMMANYKILCLISFTINLKLTECVALERSNKKTSDSLKYKSEVKSDNEPSTKVSSILDAETTVLAGLVSKHDVPSTIITKESTLVNSISHKSDHKIAESDNIRSEKTFPQNVITEATTKEGITESIIKEGSPNKKRDQSKRKPSEKRKKLLANLQKIPSNILQTLVEYVIFFLESLGFFKNVST